MVTATLCTPEELVDLETVSTNEDLRAVAALRGAELESKLTTILRKP